MHVAVVNNFLNYFIVLLCGRITKSKRLSLFLLPSQEDLKVRGAIKTLIQNQALQKQII